MADVESTVLARELGKLGGVGARWIGRLLPSVPCEKRFEIDGNLGDVGSRVATVLQRIGKAVSEFPSEPEVGIFSALVGAGYGYLNPTLVHVRLEAFPPHTNVIVRAVAKEGLIKQHTAQGAVERIEALLCGNAA